MNLVAADEVPNRVFGTEYTVYLPRNSLINRVWFFASATRDPPRKHGGMIQASRKKVT